MMYKFPALLCVVLAALLVPLGGVGVAIEFSTGLEYLYWYKAGMLIYMATYVYILYQLKEAIAWKTYADKATLPIALLMLLSVTSSLVAIFEIQSFIVLSAVFITYGAVNIYLGAVLNSLKVPKLSGYGIMLIINGALYCSILFSFLAFLTEIICMATLAVFFLSIRKDSPGAYYSRIDPLLIPIDTIETSVDYKDLSEEEQVVANEKIDKLKQRVKRSGQAPQVIVTTPSKEPSNVVDFLPDKYVKAKEWNLTLLRSLDWKVFEDLCQDYFTCVGYEAKTTELGADGGIDIVLHKKGVKVGLVQCKVRHHKQVGVNVARELLGVMAEQGVRNGVLVTNSKFSKDAESFAESVNEKKKHKLNLVDGYKLLSMINKLSERNQKALLLRTTQGDYTTPTCTGCGVKMELKTNKKNGSQFWGCPNFPRCRMTLNMAKGIVSST